MITFVALLFAAGLAQALFLLLTIFLLEDSNKPARACLLVAISAVIAMLYPELAERVGWPAAHGFGMLAELALAPALYLFVRALFAVEFPLGKRLLVHAVPYVAGAAALAVSHALLEDPMSVDAIALWVGLKACVSLYYVARALIVLRAAKAQSGPPRQQRAVRSGVRITLAAAFLLILIYVHSALYFVGLTEIDPDLSAGVFLTGLVFGVGWFIAPRRRLIGGVRPIDTEGHALWSRILDQLDTRSAYCDPRLSVERLAKALQESPRRVSQVIAAHDQRGFSGLINARRVQAFKAAASCNSNLSRTILDLAFEAGFNSKASFYRIFRELEGETPAQFRRRQHYN